MASRLPATVNSSILYLYSMRVSSPSSAALRATAPTVPARQRNVAASSMLPPPLSASARSRLPSVDHSLPSWGAQYRQGPQFLRASVANRPLPLRVSCLPQCGHRKNPHGNLGAWGSELLPQLWLIGPGRGMSGDRLAARSGLLNSTLGSRLSRVQSRLRTCSDLKPWNRRYHRQNDLVISL